MSPFELPAEVVADLDPGIRDTVLDLCAHGFETCDSGDGVSKPADWYESGEAVPCPHVYAEVEPGNMISEAHRMKLVLGAEWKVEASYGTDDCRAFLLANKVPA